MMLHQHANKLGQEARKMNLVQYAPEYFKSTRQRSVSLAQIIRHSSFPRLFTG